MTHPLNHVVEFLGTLTLARIFATIALAIALSLVLVGIWTTHKFDSFITGSQNLKEHDDQHQ